MNHIDENHWTHIPKIPISIGNRQDGRFNVNINFIADKKTACLIKYILNYDYEDINAFIKHILKREAREQFKFIKKIISNEI